MSYRPITDVWILARPKVRYYGAYPSGFLDRARALLGVSIDDTVLHVCGGKVRDYPFRGFGPNDRTVDADPALAPDYVLQVGKDPLPAPLDVGLSEPDLWYGWPAVLADPPYTEADAAKYAPGVEAFPTAGRVLRACLEVVRPGGRVGILHYAIPRPPAGARFVACVGVFVGFDNRMRAYSVFEREVAR
ncbi:MAG: hypothetical protein AB7O67_23305 [Vicinamibacterales bacterium]